MMKRHGESSAHRLLAQVLLKAESPELVIATNERAEERLSLRSRYYQQRSKCCHPQSKAPQSLHR
jgi:hypothetical protein